MLKQAKVILHCYRPLVKRVCVMWHSCIHICLTFNPYGALAQSQLSRYNMKRRVVIDHRWPFSFKDRMIIMMASRAIKKVPSIPSNLLPSHHNEQGWTSRQEQRILHFGKTLLYIKTPKTGHFRHTIFTDMKKDPFGSLILYFFCDYLSLIVGKRTTSRMEA